MPKTKAENRRSEESAHLVNVTGWACKHCNRWCGDDERMARYCCATDFPCECGGRREKHYTHCESCRKKRAAERWFSKDAVEWDGTFPIALQNTDIYFWDADEIADYLYEACDGTKSLTLDDLWLTTCEPDNGRHFEMAEYLEDSLAEDSFLDDGEINKIVNDWIEKNGPYCWRPTGERICIESVRRIAGDRIEGDEQ